MHQRLDLSRRRAAGINGPFNLACGGRLRAASRLNGYYSDQPRSQDGWHHNSLLGLHGSRAGLEAVSAFRRGAHGNIRGRAGRIWGA